MQEGIYIASSGGMNQLRKLEVLSNNLANVATPGFKKDALAFHEVLTPFQDHNNFETSRNALLEPPYSNKTVSYTTVTDFSTDHKQGGLTPTANPLDLALEGDGFFVIQTEEGERYTRKGNFRLDSENRLITTNGDLLSSTQNGEVRIPTNVGDITIDPEGTVSVGNGFQNIRVAELKLVHIEDKSTLVKEGNSLYRLADPSEPLKDPENLSVRQGFIEGSNVNVVEEMTRMIQTVRTFEAYQKIIQTIDEANDQSVNSIGRVA